MDEELKHKTWIDIASKAETVGRWYTQKDADIFNSYPFKFLCEKVDQLEEQLSEIEDEEIDEVTITAKVSVRIKPCPFCEEEQIKAM